MLLGSKSGFLNVNVAGHVDEPIKPAFANALTLIAFKVDGKTIPSIIRSFDLLTS